MARIDERRKILEVKLKEMAEDGVVKGKPKETLTNKRQRRLCRFKGKLRFSKKRMRKGQGKCRMRLPRSHWTITGHAIFTLSVSAKKQPSR